MKIEEFKEPWGESILEEHTFLKEKYTKLIDYINSEGYYKLSPNSKKIINNQKTLIEAYLSNLSIKLFDDVENTFIQDYAMLELLLSVFTGSSSMPFSSSFPTPTTDAEFNKLVEKETEE